MIEHHAADKVAGTAAIIAPIVAASVNLSDMVQIAQICAYIGSALAGVGAFIYYIWRRKK